VRQHHILCDVGRGTSVKHRGAETGFSEPDPPDHPGSMIHKWSVHQWYYHADVTVNIADDYVRRWCREFLTHGTIWTGACDSAVHRSQRLVAKPLKSSDWPSSRLGPSWPSSPSITEWMEMCRRGIDAFQRHELFQPKTDTGFTRVSRRELNENHYLATRIAVHTIVGVRSTVEVPRKFLGYFRYRSNFLIWTCTFNVPIGLVRFLLGQWFKCPSSLWLRRAVPLKTFLRKVPTSHVKHARCRLALEAVSASVAEQGACAHPADDDTDFESVASSELD
jgi:hypothetical protein